MSFRLILHSFGNILILLALIMWVPLAFTLLDGRDTFAFFTAIIITALVGLGLRSFKPESKFGRREGFVIVGIGWMILVAFGALPLYLSGSVPTYTDAYFEIMSGFTTSGASVIADVEALGHGILLWRSLVPWLGGMGIILLSLAVFSIMGVGGGASLFQAEVPSLTHEKILPRIKDTAFVLWLIYTCITLVEVIALWLAGMPVFDSIIHALGSMGTGGLSSRNLGIAAYDNVAIEIILTVFMIISGLNFSLYFRVYQRRHLSVLYKDAETKGFLIILGTAALLITASLYFTLKLPLGQSLRHAVFQAVSICSTTCYATTDYAAWPAFAQAILFILMFIGGCTGSTGGALKVARIIMLFKYMGKQILKVAQPRLMIQAKLGDTPITDMVVHQVLAYFFIYIFLFVFGGVILVGTGMDLISGFTAAAAAIGNVGNGLGQVGPLENYSALHPLAKWTLTFLMLTGRLEIMTILVMFYPGFWKK